MSDHPDWPPQSTAEGATLRMLQGLQGPDSRRRPVLLIAGLVLFLVAFVGPLVVVLIAISE